jgi:hypothetical protein
MSEEYKLNFPEPFLQKHYEKYHLEVARITSQDDNIPFAVYRGAIVKATKACGWIELKIPVGDMLTWVVEELSVEIAEEIERLTKPPKN